MSFQVNKLIKQKFPKNKNNTIQAFFIFLKSLKIVQKTTKYLQKQSKGKVCQKIYAIV